MSTGGYATKTLHLVVVDDNPSGPAYELRSKLAEGLSQFMPPRLGTDPAAYALVEERVLIIPSSNPEAAISWKHDWRLGLTTERLSTNQRADFGAGVKEAILSLGASTYLGPNRAQDAVSYWFEVLEQRRPPQTEQQKELVQEWSERAFDRIMMHFALTEDQAVNIPEEWDEMYPYAVQLSASVPECIGVDAEICDDAKVNFPELAAPDSLILREISSPEDYGDFYREISESVDLCWDVPTSADGETHDCRVFAYLQDEHAVCDPEIGLVDPFDNAGERVPTLEAPSDAEGTWRKCEFLQLSGEDRELCEFDPFCATCESGWCLPQEWVSWPPAYINEEFDAFLPVEMGQGGATHQELGSVLLPYLWQNHSSGPFGCTSQGQVAPGSLRMIGPARARAHVVEIICNLPAGN